MSDLISADDPGSIYIVIVDIHHKNAIRGGYKQSKDVAGVYNSRERVIDCLERFSAKYSSSTATSITGFDIWYQSGFGASPKYLVRINGSPAKNIIEDCCLLPVVEESANIDAEDWCAIAGSGSSEIT